MKRSVALALLLFASSGAIQAQAGEGGLIGAATGAAIGGVFGSQIVRHGPAQIMTTAAGIGLGATVGNAVGRSFDRPYARVASVEDHPSVYSDSPTVAFTSAAPNYVAPPAPPPTYIDQEAQTYCRPYSQIVHGRETYGTACLQSDGS